MMQQINCLLYSATEYFVMQYSGVFTAMNVSLQMHSVDCNIQYVKAQSTNLQGKLEAQSMCEHFPLVFGMFTALLYKY